jgi:signal transduction histidine kinase
LRRLQKINQINHDDLKLQQIDFRGMLDELEILEVRKGLPERFEIKKEIESDVSFTSDREYIFLILENLMDNAIKFHNNSRSVNPFALIKIIANEQNLVISVIDNGIGIGQANPEELFQMFVRASERSVSGGIGLYISRRATERLGGEIHMRTTPEGYTEFYVSFPLANTAEGSAKS